ncbi:MAG: DUF2087 domain-containing protein [Candidatus Krumholzibacteriota bacterium]|nr:DUF2087 domain-containing protein [Candidatus Krumholzibacteriota bacterium]
MSHRIPDSTTVEQMIGGYMNTDKTFDCIFCDESIKKGHVYPLGPELVEAELAMKNHIASAHHSTFHALLDLGKKSTGLSEIQRTLLRHFYDGLSDKEIQPLAGGVSLSTIRNHRFVLREKARQAKVFLALMELLESGDQNPGSQFIEIPGKKSAAGERFAITRTEFRKIIKANFPDGPDGMLSRFPKKQKHKIAVLVQILKRFDRTRHYAQREVNEILATASDDYTTLCRYMVDYGFLGRTRDGSDYWVE